MTMIPNTLCLSCQRFRRKDQTCTAFGTIPEDIYYYMGDHRTTRGGELTFVLDKNKQWEHDLWLAGKERAAEASNSLIAGGAPEEIGATPEASTPTQAVAEPTMSTSDKLVTGLTSMVANPTRSKR